jgi:hypothetical protein
LDQFILNLLSYDCGTQSRKTFGTWFYNICNDSSAPTGTGIAFLELYVADDNGEIREALYEALKTALLSRRRYTLARFWKRAGDGAMTAKDREHGYSYESRYPLLGMHCWSEVEAMTLPNLGGTLCDR